MSAVKLCVYGVECRHLVLQIRIISKVDLDILEHQRDRISCIKTDLIWYQTVFVQCLGQSYDRIVHSFILHRKFFI